MARVSDFSLIGSSVTWEFEKLNIGFALNLANGYFTAPVSGRFFLASSCSGKRVDYNIPKSCYELSIIGHSLNGLYSVMGAEEKKIEMVYCDFNLAPDDENWSTYFLFYFHFNLREKAKKKAWLCASQIRWIWRLFLCPTID